MKPIATPNPVGTPSLFRLFRTAALIVRRHAPRWALCNIVLTLLQGIFPLISLLIVRHLVDVVAKGGGTAAIWPAASRSVLALAAVTLLSGTLRTLSEYVSERLSFHVTDAMMDTLHAHATKVDLALHEDPQSQDLLHRALMDAPSRPSRMVQSALQLIQQTLTLLGLAGIFFSVNKWLTLILLLAAIPSAWSRWRHIRMLHVFTREKTELERRAWYLHWVQCDSTMAKEVRVFGLGQVFGERYHVLRLHLREARDRISSRRIRADVIANAIASIGLASALLLVVAQAARGVLTVGLLVMVFQGVTTALGALQSLIRGTASLGEDALSLAHYEEFLHRKPTIISPPSPQPIPPPGLLGIQVHQLRYTYPGQSHPALNGVDLHLPTGKIVALVGENGSGKTTLIKQLCRLYDPDHGRITIEGTDLRDCDPEAWRREVSVIFQDFGRYALTAWENIWLGNIHDGVDRTAIIDAAKRAGIHRRICELPEDYDSMLGRRFYGGSDLSSGEWQRVALARALLRPSRLLILDEPTSSLDPLAEEQFFRFVRNNIDCQSVLLVSHRFSTVRLADEIYVLAGGRVVQYGTHESLLQQSGPYARAYESQARGYRVDAVVGDTG